MFSPQNGIFLPHNVAPYTLCLFWTMLYSGNHMISSCETRVWSLQLYLYIPSYKIALLS